MTKQRFAVAFVIFLILCAPISTIAANGDEKPDTDTRILDAKVTEVAESHISILARSGVEHVIAVDPAGTKITVNGETAALKDLRKGDVVAVELDPKRSVKFANSISARSEQVAKLRR